MKLGKSGGATDVVEGLLGEDERSGQRQDARQRVDGELFAAGVGQRKVHLAVDAQVGVVGFHLGDAAVQRRVFGHVHLRVRSMNKNNSVKLGQTR